MASFEFLLMKSPPHIVICVPVGGLESTKFINLIPLTTVAWLLQYSGYRVEHMVGFSSLK